MSYYFRTLISIVNNDVNQLTGFQDERVSALHIPLPIRQNEGRSKSWCWYYRHQVRRYPGVI
jgi:hypothetical protein